MKKKENTVESVLTDLLEAFFETYGFDDGDQVAGINEIVDRVFDLRGISEEQRKEIW